MANPRIRESLDGSESNFSLIEHGFAEESALSDAGQRDADGASAAGGGSTANLKAYYPISTIMSNPRAASAAQTISTNLSNLNPLRPTTGPKTGATRGKAATPIVLSDLPKVSPKSFEAYINSIKDDFTAWSKIQSALADAPVLEELDDDDALLDEEASKRKKAIKRALETSNISSKVGTKLELPPLDSIPPIFFEENYDLANPRTFDTVTGGQTDESGREQSGKTSTPPRTDFATDQILQEKLSYWLDIVEVHLNVEISLRSASFFSALSNLKELDSQSAEAVKQIGELKNILTEVDEKVARKGLQAVRQGVRRRRLNNLDVALERIKEVLRAIDQAEDLGEAGETEGALDLADEIEREWESSLSNAALQIPPTPAVEHKQEETMAAISEENEDVETEIVKTAKPPATPLTALRLRGDHHAPVRIANIKCMANIPTRLATLRSGIAQNLEHELVAVLLHALREGRETLLSSTQQWRANPGTSAPVYDEIRDSSAGRIRACLYGLVRCGKPALDDALAAWREIVLKEVKRMMRDVFHLSSVHDEDDTPAENSPSSRSSVDGGRSDATSTPTKGVQHLNQAEYLQTMRDVHTSMLAILILADIQSRAIVMTVSSIFEAKSEASRSAHVNSISSEKALNEAWSSAIQSEATDAVQAVAELINVRLARVVASRGDAHSHLPLFDFWTSFQESWQFVLDCEIVCKKMIVGLRGVIVGQAKAFLQHFHQQTFLEVAKAVEQEQWSPADVPASDQAIVDRILQSAVETPSAWDFKRESDTGENSAEKTSKQLAIEDRSYFAVSATLRCLEALESYLKVVVNLSLLSTDVMSRIIEFLKQYNSRVCQMVLGAGAMRSAGLKNITAKHLAMASQSISILINIIPYTRECLRRHLRAKQAVILVDFDKIKRDCQEHQNEIHAKLVAIMGDRLAVHCKTLQGLDWENPATEAGKPNAYMETLVKETGTLHKVLLRYLAGNALEIVMMQVLSAINSRLAEEYSKIPLKSAAAKDRMLVDANFLKDKFADLKGLERPAPGAELVHLVQDKPVEQPRPPLQAKGRQFSTPSMTRPQKTASSHVRTPSTLSVTQAESAQSASESPSQPEERGNTTEALGDTAKSLPTLDTTGKAPDKEDATVEVASEQTVNQEAVQIPLPKSPEGEEQPSISEVIGSVEAVRPASKEDNAPATPLKDERAFSPPVPEKHDNAGTPTGNVKNRLASLFSKRPSIPAIEVPALPIHLPKIAVPTLHHSNAPRAATESASDDQRIPQEEIKAADGDKLDSSHIAKSASAASAGSDLVQPTKESISEPGQVIINSSEGSTEDLAVQTTSDSLVETDVSESIATGETPKQAQNVDDKQASTEIETEQLAVGPASPDETIEAEEKPMTIKTEPDEDHTDASTSSSKPEIEDNDSAMNTPATSQDTQEPADTSGSTEDTFVTESDASAEEATTAAGGNDLDDID